MKGVRINTEGQGGYESGDFVVSLPDDHIYCGGDLKNGRTSEDLGALSDEDSLKLTMRDEVVGDYSAHSLPTFRSLSTGFENLKTLHRRKYKFDGGVQLKPNAQEKT